VTTTVSFDKLAYVDRLKQAGIEEGHARALADSLDQALREQVMTKADFAPLDTKLDRLDGRINLLAWMVGTNVTLTLIVLGKLLLTD
jgi:hypothetical protein